MERERTILYIGLPGQEQFLPYRILATNFKASGFDD